MECLIIIVLPFLIVAIWGVITANNQASVDYWQKRNKREMENNND